MYQELLLILDEYWQDNPQLQNIPIWYASKLASRALRVYQTYANMMNARIRAQMDVSNPFSFRYIQNLKSIDVNSFDDSGPCVVFASPGMLQSGVSRQLFDRWAGDPKNGVMIAGYAVEHTLAKEIMAQPKEVVTLEGRKQPLNCLVDYVSFSAHVDFVQNRSFITQVAPKHIILVHGQKDEMGRLKSALMLQYKQYPESKRPTITMPPNQIEVKLKFARRRSAKVMGSLADRERQPQEGESVRGILVTHNFHSKLMAPDDVSTYTPLRVGSIASKLHVPFAGALLTLKLFLHEMFAGVREEESVGAEDEIVTTLTLHGGEVRLFEVVLRLLLTLLVTILYSFCASARSSQVKVIAGTKKGVVTVEWEASPAGDVIADSVVALIMHAQSCGASIRLTSKPCRHPRDSALQDDSSGLKKVKIENGGSELVHSRLRFVRALLKEQFQNVEAAYEATRATYEIETDAGLEDGLLDDDGKLKCSVTVEFDDSSASLAKISVECTDNKLATNIQNMLQNAIAAASAVKTRHSE